jgi:hypothetical protein
MLKYVWFLPNSIGGDGNMFQRLFECHHSSFLENELLLASATAAIFRWESYGEETENWINIILREVVGLYTLKVLDCHLQGHDFCLGQFFHAFGEVADRSHNFSCILILCY